MLRADLVCAQPQPLPAKGIRGRAWARNPGAPTRASSRRLDPALVSCVAFRTCLFFLCKSDDFDPRRHHNGDIRPVASSFFAQIHSTNEAGRFVAPRQSRSSRKSPANRKQLDCAAHAVSFVSVSSHSILVRPLRSATTDCRR